MRFERAWLVVALCAGAAGCVSSGTWSAWHRADAELERDAVEVDEVSTDVPPRSFAFA